MQPVNTYQHTGQVDNIDERDTNDLLCASEYVSGMYEYFRLKEHSTSVRPYYMERQPHINEKMRSILTDWLVEVHLKFKLIPETLYLTINLIDRFLEKYEVPRPKLQLVGVTSLLIAAQYEEIYPPEIRDLVYICDRAYTKQEILIMEETILRTLKYQIKIPSAAAAAVFIARRCIGRNTWSPTLLVHAGYCEEEVIPVARVVLQEKFNSSTDLNAVNKKYSSSRYGNVDETTLVIDF
jgi:cyclin B